ncbi:MAG: hypothetical protein HYV04_05960 [Deltaproteobacteria bacterium]|nr:hypothetical protein [Deltaproteobacteria bacterium]
MARPLRRILIGLLVLWTTGCSPHLVVRGGVVDAEKLKEIKTGLAAMRGLEFKADVPIEVRNQAEFKRYMSAELDREYGEEKLKDLALAYGKLGLYPEQFDVKGAVLEFYGSQVAAFYDPRAKKLFLPEDLSAGMMAGVARFLAQRDVVGEMVLAHELTHALQDQHFLLAEKLQPSSSDDKSLALRAVVEGDATLSGFGYLFGGFDETTLPQVNEAVQNSIREARTLLTDLPEAIVEELLFQYYGGVSFVAQVLQERGWLGVTLLYRYPPVSTEQILHPERFFDLPDPPIRIVLNDLDALFPPGWRQIENNVLGEVMVQALFKRFIPAADAKAAAAGWGGDRFMAFRRGDEVALVWATAWDSAEDATEFVARYHEILAAKQAGSASDSTYAHVEQRDRRVLVVEGLAKEHVVQAVHKIWQGMVLEPEPFDPFFARLKSKRSLSR